MVRNGYFCGVVGNMADNLLCIERALLMIDEQIPKPICPYCADNHGSAFECGELNLKKIALKRAVEVFAIDSQMKRPVDEMQTSLNRIIEMIDYLN